MPLWKFHLLGGSVERLTLLEILMFVLILEAIFKTSNLNSFHLLCTKEIIVVIGKGSLSEGFHIFNAPHLLSSSREVSVLCLTTNLAI